MKQSHDLSWKRDVPTVSLLPCLELKHLGEQHWDAAPHLVTRLGANSPCPAHMENMDAS